MVVVVVVVRHVVVMVGRGQMSAGGLRERGRVRDREKTDHRAEDRTNKAEESGVAVAE